MTVVLRTIPAAREWVQAERSGGKTIGLVPTMGSLHEGHVSLIRRARQGSDRVAVSIFVNPLQFAPGEDYERYPRDFDRDFSLLEREGVDAVFYPGVQDIYPDKAMYPGESMNPDERVIRVCVGKLGDTLCGASRPGHFNGVATVVAKLFNILQPYRAFFGQKDAQQVIIVKRMLQDLNFPLEIVVCPTVREPDGLAMSSRNAYLSTAERAQAPILYRCLRHAEGLVRAGEREAARLEREMREMIGGVPAAELDYARVVDSESLADVERIERKVLAAVAARFGRTRLIDNVMITPEKTGRE